MEKNFNLMYNVGKAKYVVNFHDGNTTHPDGSPFYGIFIFHNKKKANACLRSLLAEGYKATNGVNF